MKEKSEVSRSNLMPKIVQSSSSRPLPFLESSPFSRSSPSDLRDFLVSVRESRERERERDLDLGERDLFRQTSILTESETYLVETSSEILTWTWISTSWATWTSTWIGTWNGPCGLHVGLCFVTLIGCDCGSGT